MVADDEAREKVLLRKQFGRSRQYFTISYGCGGYGKQEQVKYRTTTPTVFSVHTLKVCTTSSETLSLVECKE